MAKSIEVLTRDTTAPAGWHQAKLGDIAEVSGGGSAPQGKEFFGGSNRFVRVQHVDNGVGPIRRWDMITDAAVKKYRLRLFPGGTILVPKSGASIRLEKRGLLLEDSYVVSHLATVLPNPEVVDNDFLFFKLASLRLAREKADGYPTLGIGEIRNVDLLLPPLQEQGVIAASLRAIQRTREATEKVIVGMRELKRSLLRHLFTFGPRVVADARSVESVETALGRLPREWRILTFKDVLLTGTQNGIYKPRDAYGEGLPIVDMVDIFRSDILSSPAERLNLQPAEIEKYGLREGDLLFARRSFKPEGAGKCQLVPHLDEPTVFSSSIIRARPDPSKADSRYLLYFFMSHLGREVIRQIVRHLAVSGISGGDLKGIITPVPPLADQALISEILQAVDSKIKAETQRLETLTQTFDSALHNLMSGSRQMAVEGVS